MTGKKKKELFYQLENSEVLRAIRELTPSEKDLFFYYRTLNPFGDRAVYLNIPEVANLFGCHRSTLNKALKSLVKKGWLNVIVEIRAAWGEKQYLQKVTDSLRVAKNQDTEEVSQSTVAKNQDTEEVSQPTVAKNQHTQAESQSQQGIQNPHTLKTNKTKKDSLSDAKKYFDFLGTLWPEERESWDKFIQEKISRLPQKPCLLDEWLIALSAIGKSRWESLSEEWAFAERQKGYARTNVPVGVDDKANSFIKWLEKLTNPLEVKRNIQAVLRGFVYGNYVDTPLELNSVLDLPLEQIKQQLNWRSV